VDNFFLANRLCDICQISSFSYFQQITQLRMPKLKKKSVAKKLRDEKQQTSHKKPANTAARRLVRQDEARRKQAQTADTESHRLARQDEARRIQEQTANTESRRLARQDQTRREQEQTADKESHRLARQDQARRQQEQVANTESHRLARQDTVRRSTERRTFWDAEKKRRNSSKSNYEKLLERYINQIQESPSYICSCCGGLWYIKSTTCASKEKLIKSGCKTDFINTVLHVNQEQHRFCATCKKSVAEMQVPRLCLSNGFDFPVLSNDVKVLWNSRE
jgi:hypothetical protein